MSSIQLIRSKRTNGLQARVFRDGRCVLSEFFAFQKHGGERSARLLAAAALPRLEQEATRRYGPPIRHSNEKGQHHVRPSRRNTSLFPGIALRYRFRKGRGYWGVHVTWQAGEGDERRQRHREFALATHGPHKALTEALKLRQEKTGILQVSPDIVWFALCQTLTPDAAIPPPPVWDGP